MRDDCPKNRRELGHGGAYNIHEEPCLWCSHLDLADAFVKLSDALTEMAKATEIVKEWGEEMHKLKKKVAGLDNVHETFDDEDDDTLGECMMDHYPGDSQ